MIIALVKLAKEYSPMLNLNIIFKFIKK